MGEFAVRAIGIAPLVVQGKDLLDLLGQDRVQRTPTRRGILESALGSSGIPTVGPYLGEVEHVSCAPQGPARFEGVIEEDE